MQIYNPENFIPEELLPKPLHKWADDARYFIHKIYTGRVFGKRKKTSFTQLKTRYLLNVLSERKFPAIRQSLIENGVVICDGRFITGKKAYGYRLTGEYLRSGHRLIELDNPRIIRRVAENEQRRDLTTVQQHLEQYIHQTEIDLDAALLEIAHLKYEPNGIHTKHAIAISAIHDKQFFCLTDAYGRLHTNITNLKRVLRKHLLWNNQTLVEIDICNSQPYFLALMISNLQADLDLSTLAPLYPLRSDILPPDTLAFIQLAISGRLYNYLAKYCDLNRRAIKNQLFSDVLFGRQMGNTPVGRLFCDRFPSVCEAIRRLKAKDYRDLARLLQKIESKHVIDGVARRWMHLYPEAYIATIHDSFLTTADMADKLVAIIREEIGDCSIKLAQLH